MACGKRKKLKRETEGERKERYRKYSEKYNRSHKKILAVKERAYAAKNKEKRYLSFRDWRMKSKYGINLDTYEDILQQQNGKCRICEEFQTNCKRRFAVDHCHRTGKVRGLLCLKCNVTIGLMGDNSDILRKAAEYLDRFNSYTE